MADLAPYPGPLKEGDRGPAVVAIQGGLQHWGVPYLKAHPKAEHVRTYLPTGDFLHPTALQLGEFQKVHHLEVTNSFGPKVHAELARFYTAADRAILRELHAHATVLAYRAELAAWMDATAGKRDGWQYTQSSSRMMLLGPPPLDLYKSYYVRGDCSSTVCSAIEIVAAKYGFTTKLGSWPTTRSAIDVGIKVSIGDLAVGDRVHYGANSHMGMFRGKRPGWGDTLWVWSFGQEPGPEWRELTYRPIYACRRDVVAA